MHFNALFSNKKKLKNKTIGIAGCGGLGSNCAIALARVGIGKLVLCDFDIIEESNLNRQYFFKDQVGQKKMNALADNIQRITKDTEIEIHSVALDKKNIPIIFKNCDIVVEAFDKSDMKQMIAEVVSEKLSNMPLVMGLGMAGYGSNNTISMQKYDKIYICGDQQTEVSKEFPPIAPRVGIVANMQANTVLEILLK